MHKFKSETMLFSYTANIPVIGVEAGLGIVFRRGGTPATAPSLWGTLHTLVNLKGGGGGTIFQCIILTFLWLSRFLQWIAIPLALKSLLDSTNYSASPDKLAIQYLYTHTHTQLFVGAIHKCGFSYPTTCEIRVWLETSYGEKEHSILLWTYNFVIGLNVHKQCNRTPGTIHKCDTRKEHTSALGYNYCTQPRCRPGQTKPLQRPWRPGSHFNITLQTMPAVQPRVGMSPSV